MPSSLPHPHTAPAAGPGATEKFPPIAGYGFAWVGHFVFEKNRPASFRRPLWSFMGDWRMYFDIWTGKVAI